MPRPSNSCLCLYYSSDYSSIFLMHSHNFHLFLWIIYQTLQLCGQYSYIIFWRSNILTWTWSSTMRFFMVFQTKLQPLSQTSCHSMLHEWNIHTCESVSEFYLPLPPVNSWDFMHQDWCSHSVTMESTIFWNVTVCSLVEVQKHFGGVDCLHFRVQQ